MCSKVVVLFFVAILLYVPTIVCGGSVLVFVLNALICYVCITL